MGEGAVMIRAVGLTKRYGTQEADARFVLDNLNLEVGAGTIATLIGPNGSGKTTFLNIVAGMIRADAGSVQVGSSGGSPRIGYVWQDYRSSLLPWLSAEDNIAFPLRLQGMSRHERSKIARAAAQRFLPALDVSRPCHELSGGQQQMVSVLRSLVSKPDVLLLDEPFSALDQESRWSMAYHVQEAWMSLAVPTVFVSHDIDEAIMLGDEIHLMSRREGRVIESLRNPTARPRTLESLKSHEHLRCRAVVLDFLVAERSAIGKAGASL
jgi:NitT/TauT family transport system ATP-binding protein